MCVGNLQWLKSNGVVAIVNTAKNLESFFRKFDGMVTRAKRAGIEFFECGWIDSGTQVLEWEVLAAAITFIAKVIRGGGSVLIHCAQGKSRSSTVSAAFAAVACRLSVEEALTEVQARRQMAQPNHGFMEQLLTFEREGRFAKLSNQVFENEH